MRVYRLHPKTGARQEPKRDRDGFFVLGAPQHGDQKHVKENKVRVRTEEEMIDLVVSRGHSVRVEAGGRGNMVRLNIFVDGRKVT